MKFKYWIIGIVVIVFLVFLGLDIYVKTAEAERNGVYVPPPYKVDAETEAFHQTLFVADLHADPLLWNRDLSKRSDRGQLDLPRLLEGNIGLQVFGVVTKVPSSMNYDRNSGDTDQITLLAVASRWPPNTWTSLKNRALYQARELDQLVTGSKGSLMWVRNRGDLETLIQKQNGGEKVAGAMLGLEGCQALEGVADNVDVLFDHGYRMLGIAHFFDNEIGGSAHGLDRGGLTEIGREVVKRAQVKGMLIDVAHASPKSFDDVIGLAELPIVASHIGVKQTCDSPRNLSDDQLRALASTGGVAGIGFFSGATCGDDVESIIRAIMYAVSVVGADHVALGSDFDGAVSTPMDATGMKLITDALRKEDLDEDQIRAIMGGNVLRILRAALPPE